MRATLYFAPVLAILIMPVPTAAEDKSTRPQSAVLEFKNKADNQWAELYVESFSWGETETSGKISKVDAIAIKQGVQRDEVVDQRTYEDLADDGSAITSNTKWKNVVLKRSLDTSAASTSITQSRSDPISLIPHATVESPRDSTSGQASGKRQQGTATPPEPHGRGSLELHLAQPWPGCRVGDRFDGLYLTTNAAHRYRLDGAEVLHCMEQAVSINFVRIARDPS